MYSKQKVLLLLIGLAVLTVPASTRPKPDSKSSEFKVETTGSVPEVLWREPANISTRNLFYGPGGKKHEPHGVFTFVEEDLEGSNPKIVVRDQDGVKWKVKLGLEARPETAASRLVWAAGYFANEDYFVPRLYVSGLPQHLTRGQKFVEPGGCLLNARLKRSRHDEKKIGKWEWRESPFADTREFNGLRVLMAVINNWDLKDENNAVIEESNGSGDPERIYMVTDLGASFGTNGLTWPLKRTRGNLKSYEHSRFIRRVTPAFVDFYTPARPPRYVWVARHKDYKTRVRQQWIGREIPLKDARWMGHLLSRLSHQQIRDAFRAADYTPLEVEAFAGVIEERIGELNQL